MNHARRRTRMKWNRRAERVALLAMVPVVFLLVYGMFRG